MAFTISFDLAAGLKDLNTFLESRSYVVGYTPSAADAALFTALGKEPESAKFPNVARFYRHIAALSADARAKLPAAIGGVSVGGAAPKAAAKAAAPAAEEEDADLFGDDGDAAAASVKAVKPKEAEKKKEKAKPVAKTICVYEVKPACEEGEDDDDTKDAKIATPAEMEAAIRTIQMDGLIWSETFNAIEIGWGVKKLLVQFVCEDEKVSLDDIEERMLAFEDVIQSVDQMSMNKFN